MGAAQASEVERRGPAIETARAQTERCVRQRLWRKAAEAYKQLAELEPNEPQHRVRQGDCLRRAGDVPAALDAFLLASQGFLKRGQLVKASAACRALLFFCPEAAEVRSQLDAVQARLRLVRTLPAAAPAEPPPSAAPTAEARRVEEAPLEMPPELFDELYLATGAKRTQPMLAAVPVRPAARPAAAPRPLVPPPPAAIPPSEPVDDGLPPDTDRWGTTTYTLDMP